MKTRDIETDIQAFRDQGGTLPTRDFIAFGMHTATLYALRESGQIVEASSAVAVPSRSNLGGTTLYQGCDSSKTDSLSSAAPSALVGAEPESQAAQ